MVFVGIPTEIPLKITTEIAPRILSGMPIDIPLESLAGISSEIPLGMLPGISSAIPVEISANISSKILSRESPLMSIKAPPCVSACIYQKKIVRNSSRYSLRIARISSGICSNVPPGNRRGIPQNFLQEFHVRFLQELVQRFLEMFQHLFIQEYFQ